MSSGASVRATPQAVRGVLGESRVVLDFINEENFKDLSELLCHRLAFPSRTVFAVNQNIDRENDNEKL
jgi:hypothetical protein